MEELKKTVASQLAEAVSSNKINIASPFAVVTKTMEIIQTFPNLNGYEKKALLMKTLREVAAGKDGVLGTDDDLLPPRTVEGIQVLLDKDLMEDLTSTVLDIAKGKVNFKKVAETAKKSLPILKGCLAPLFAKLTKSKN
jgi:hypothetical protein